MKPAQLDLAFVLALRSEKCATKQGSWVLESTFPFNHFPLLALVKNFTVTGVGVLWIVSLTRRDQTIKFVLQLFLPFGFTSRQRTRQRGARLVFLLVFSRGHISFGGLNV
jgi:hypothetical protein